jgi:hypothetical protein
MMIHKSPLAPNRAITLSWYAVLIGLAVACSPLRSDAQTYDNAWMPSGLELTPTGDTVLSWDHSAYSTSNAFNGESLQLWTLGSNDTESSKTKTILKGANWALDGGGYAPDGTLRVGWAERGAVSTTTGEYSGDAIEVWSLTGDGVKTSAGPKYSKGEGWYSYGVIVMPDGTLRAYWTKPGKVSTTGVYSGTTVSIWTLDTTGTVTARGPDMFGGSSSYPSALAAASDGTLRLLWEKISADVSKADTATVWTIDSNGNETGESAELSKGPGWLPTGLGIAGDDTLRLWWKAQGAVEKLDEWTLDTSGVELSEGPDVDGPASMFTNFIETASDGSSRVLWSNVSGASNKVSVWNFDTTGAVFSEGPNLSKGGSWTAGFTPILILSDGSVQILWTHPPTTGKPTSGEASVWTLDDTGGVIEKGPTYSF